jgi:hypothetical protein
MSPGDDEATTNPTAINAAPKAPVNGNHHHSPPAPCHHEQSLRAIHTDLDSMRQLITCSVCQRFMYEPYALSCGHTYCYSCLAEWMGKNHKKSCPDCRTHVKQEPTPAYLIKEMVLIFVNRTQLLPDGETSEEHHLLAKEEKAIVDKDRADTDARQGGLFKGSFSRPAARPLIAVHDSDDHVDRCPSCLHEVEDGWCLTCHLRVRSSYADPDESDDSDGTDHTDMGDETDLSEEMELDVEARNMTREFFGPGGLHVYSDEEDSGEDLDQDLSGFIEEEVRYDSDADEPDYPFEGRELDDSPRGQRRVPIVVSDVSDVSEDEEGSEEEMIRRPQHTMHRTHRIDRRSAPSSARARVVVVDTDDEQDEGEDDDDDVPVPSNSQRGHRRRNFVDLNTEEVDEDGEDDEASEEEHDLQWGSDAPSEDESEGTTRGAIGGFSPLDYSNVSPTHFGPYGHRDLSESSMGDEGGMNVNELEESDARSERSDDQEEGEEEEEDEEETDGMGTDAPGSDEESDGSEHSTATGWDSASPFDALGPTTNVSCRYSR